MSSMWNQAVTEGVSVNGRAKYNLVTDTPFRMVPPQALSMAKLPHSMFSSSEGIASHEYADLKCTVSHHVVAAVLHEVKH